MSIKSYLDQAFYPKLRDNWDDNLFRDRLLDVVTREMSGLDFGAGRGNLKQLDLRGRLGYIAGVDPDPIVYQNPFLNDAKVLDLKTEKIDFPDNTFDIAYADNVFEHLSDPKTTLVELFRVLKPGGILMAKTPNIYHYMPLIARYTPTWFHKLYNSFRGRSEEDTFPTLYRANSRNSLRRFAAEVGFDIRLIDMVEGRPEYLRIWWPVYLVGICYEKFVNSSVILENFRSVIYVDFIKPKE